MAVGVGDILFTALFTDPGTGAGQGAEGLSFVATTTIAAGETITINAPDGDGGTGPGNSMFTFTVGVDGLQSGDFVRFTFNATGTPTILQDPSNGSVSAISLTGGQTGMVVASADNIIASSGGQAIAAITNDSTTEPLTNAHLIVGVSTTAINAAIALPTDPLPVIDLNEVTGLFIDDNSIWVGGAFTGIDDPANWIITNDAVDHASPNIGGVTFVTQEAAICFSAGTLIATDVGEVPVEELLIGDLVRTVEGNLVGVRWIGRQTVNIRFGPPERLLPVRFSVGALGEGLPCEPLTVTADHGMLVDGVICHAGALVNGTTITRVPLEEMGETYTVYHIETEAHEIILANGAPAETFIDNVSRRVFDNFAEFEALYGDVPEMEELDYPRAMSARQVPSMIQARLAARLTA
jgi:hypothetical protein